MKIEKKKIRGNEFSFCPSRGGIVTSLKFKGKEILYLDKKTFLNVNENVRGGVPILFPNAGPINENSKFSDLKQHGFARNMKWQKEKSKNGFKETLVPTPETIKIYPYDFCLSFSGKFNKNNSFTLIQKIKNKEEKKTLPVSMGLHPYFKIADKKKMDIKFDFDGAEKVKAQMGKWLNGEHFSIDNPKIKNKNNNLKIEIPDSGVITISPSAEYQKIWFWSLPGKDFICIEPVMRDVNGLIDNPKRIKPQESFEASLNIKLDNDNN